MIEYIIEGALIVGLHATYATQQLKNELLKSRLRKMHQMADSEQRIEELNNITIEYLPRRYTKSLRKSISD